MEFESSKEEVIQCTEFKDGLMQSELKLDKSVWQGRMCKEVFQA